tara:strand:+ start:6093 stop:6254 length:162 start_codon:yes stop_codon:yes gene_type:complete
MGKSKKKKFNKLKFVKSLARVFFNGMRMSTKHHGDEKKYNRKKKHKKGLDSNE